ncbi:hypothetical protein [Frankia canadensis]|nr:hypothetical protein [Frankia canadensis]
MGLRDVEELGARADAGNLDARFKLADLLFEVIIASIMIWLAEDPRETP